ncbi:MAG TPA: FAD-binding oxidoreductase [Vicinamibacterales bacterium]|nr:FAD-binding oxidoreductase [Vicinamibacterales bacterium]
MPFLQRDPAILAGFLEDAAHFPGGHAAAIALPASDAEVADVLRSASAVLPIGAQSSLTGGATPMGEVLLGTSRLNRIVEIGEDVARVQAGVTLAELDSALAAAGKYYPPAPTFTGACVGGTVATNAAGATTFKYGTTRAWVRAVRVVLASGEAIEVERGVRRASAFAPVPTYRLPHVAKCSAGYFAAPDMDLVDLFIGSEGTLGVITEVTLRVLPQRPAHCLAFVTFADRGDALALVDRLRRDAEALHVSAIEHMDARSLALLREDGIDRQCGVTIERDAAIAILISIELPPDTTAEQAYADIGAARDARPADRPLVRLCRALDAAGALDRTDIAVPGDAARAAQLVAVREAVPAAVNARVGRAKQSIDAGISKTAADMIVPFDRLGELMALYDAEFARRGLDAAVWGHISDGNLHPNVLPRSIADVESGKEAILAFGRAVIRMGGSPLAEHGVGRNPIKQQLLREMYGEHGIDEMRAVKRALDPEWKLAPGVLFTRGR